MWSDPEEPDENLTDDWDTRVQDGGRLSVQNTQALDRLYDPKQAQSQFTGEALLDSQTKRLRLKAGRAIAGRGAQTVTLR